MSEAGHALRVLLRTTDPVRSRGLAAMVEAAGHVVVADTPDVVLCDLAPDAAPPGEAEAPVVALTGSALNAEQPAGVLPRDVAAAQLDAALRAVASGLMVRAPGGFPPD